jgi:uncharacterized protein (TIGR03382 family)
MRPIIFLTAITSLLAATPSDSDACSPSPCQPGFFTPGNGAIVPANLPAIHWRPTSGFGTSPADPSKVILASAAAPSTPLPFTATRLPDGNYALVPEQPLTPGTSYVLTDQSACGGTPTGPSVTFQVTGAAPLPRSLGALVETTNLVGRLQVATGGGACSSEVDAHQLGIELQLASEAMAWRDALHFETLVDERVWRPSGSAPAVVPPGASWRGRGVDLLYRVCTTEDDFVSEGLAAGPHEAAMRATLPGSGTVLWSSSLPVSIECAGDDLPDADEAGGGCDAGGSGSTGWWLLGSLAAVARLRRRTARRSWFAVTATSTT